MVRLLLRLFSITTNRLGRIWCTFSRGAMAIEWVLCAFITARKRSLGKGNIFSSVCQEFCPRGGVCLSARWDTTCPPPGGADTHLRADTPQDQAPPCAVHAGIYGQQAGGMHPTGMQSCCYCDCDVKIIAFAIVPCKRGFTIPNPSPFFRLLFYCITIS